MALVTLVMGSLVSTALASETHFVSVNDTQSSEQSGNYSNDGAKSIGAIAIGIDASSDYKGSIAIGKNAEGIGSDGNGISHYAATSIAIGEGTSARGGSIAIGEKASGIAQGDLALGRGAKAQGTTKATGGKNFGAALSIGNYSGAKGVGAIAIGLRTKANEEFSIAIGGSGTTKADAKYAIAIGDATWAKGENSFALGKTAKASAADGIAIGRGVITDGKEAIAFGYGARASGVKSIALGSDSVAEVVRNNTKGLYSGIDNTDTTMGVVSIGNSRSQRRLINLAPGVNSTDAVNVGQLQALVEKIGYTTDDNGLINNAGDRTVLARLSALELNGGSGEAPADTNVHFISVNSDNIPAGSVNYANDGAQRMGAIAIGVESAAKSEYSIAMGHNVSATGGILEGYKTYYYPSIGIGKDIKATGRDTIAIGRNIRVDGKDAVGIGRDSIAEGKTTLAIGLGAIARLEKRPDPPSDWGYATAVGPKAMADAPYTAAFGSNAKAHAKYAVAIGDFAGVYGERGISLGEQAKTGMSAEKNYVDGIAIGSEAKSEMNEAVAIGRKAWSRAKSSIAIGRESETKLNYKASRAKWSGIINSDAETGGVSFGREKRGFTIKEINRRLTHVAGGVDSTDAVNVSQLQALADKIGYTTGEDGTINNAGDKTILARLAELEKSGVNDNKPVVGVEVGKNLTKDEKGSISVVESPSFSGKVTANEGFVMPEGYWDKNGIYVGNHKVTGVQAGEAETDAVNKGQLDKAIQSLKSDNHSVPYIQTNAMGKEKTVASGEGSVAVGAGAQAKGSKSIALGSGSIAELPETNTISAFTEKQNKDLENGVVSVGKVGNERRIMNVADGSLDTDAANIGQLRSVSGQITKVQGEVAEVQGQLSQLDERVTRTEIQINRVGALSAALSALKPLNPIGDEEGQIMAGVGYYENRFAAALGYGRYLGEDRFIHGGVAYDSEKVMAQAGITLRIGRNGETKRGLRHENEELRKELNEQRDLLEKLAEKIEKMEG